MNETGDGSFLSRRAKRRELYSFVRKPALWLPLTLATLLLTGAPSHAPAETDVRRDATVNAVEQVMPSVVNIATETVIEYHELYDDLLRQFYGWSRAPRHQQKLFNLGSGVIIDEDGYVLTNFHVVRRAGRIQVKLWDGREYDADPWVYTEATDIAVLKLRRRRSPPRPQERRPRPINHHRPAPLWRQLHGIQTGNS